MAPPRASGGSMLDPSPRGRGPVPQSAHNSDNVSDDSEGEQPYSGTLSSIKTQKTSIRLSLRADYGQWSSIQAFRELVQNQRDAIIESFKLPEGEFKVQCEGNVFKIPVPDGGPVKYAGYITRSGPVDAGLIEIVNRRATLQPKNFDFGSSDKRGDEKQAGMHGEGLKIAIITLLRHPQNHHVKCYSGGWSWTFNFSKDHLLLMNLHKLTQKGEADFRMNAEKRLAKHEIPFVPDPNNDVIFIIGERILHRRDENGNDTTRVGVSADEFQTWRNCATFLLDIPRDQIVSTAEGDLILDPELGGNVFLKGLWLRKRQLPNGQLGTGILKYAYNFNAGSTSRDRERLRGRLTEAQAINAIWREALCLRPDLIGRLHDMINTPLEAQPDDVELAREMSYGTAKRLQVHLFSDPTKWYFSADECNQNSGETAAIENLGCQGMRLQNTYWRILRDHKLIRTAEEELKERFLKAMTINAPNHGFSREVGRLLRACLRGCAQTGNIKVYYVKAGPLYLRAILIGTDKDQVAKVHEQWLDKASVQDKMPFIKGQPDGRIIAHVVQTIFQDILIQIPDKKWVQAGSPRTGSYHREAALARAQQSLMDYNALLDCCELRLGPNGHMYLHLLDRVRSLHPLRVDVHQSVSCSHMKNKLLGKDVPDTMECFSEGEYGPATCSHVTTAFGIVVDVGKKPAHLYGRGSCSGVITAPGHRVVDVGKKPADFGVEYFLMIFKPDDPTAIMRFCSDTLPAAAQPLPTPAESASGPPTYVLGERISSLDVLVQRDWYAATQGDAIIGLRSGRSVRNVARKRARVLDDDDDDGE